MTLADIFFLWPVILVHIFLTESVGSGEFHVGSLKVCALMNCDNGENCINRKFWCKKPPCPSMAYCSKTPRESLKGPITCASVRCTKGYICLVRVRGCLWNQKCKQQIARCVSEKDYHDEPASCADSNCPSGYQCILKESFCALPPCKLMKSCAKTEDVEIWHNRCRMLGCPSEYECFLREASDNSCSSESNVSCKHTPDCAITDDLSQADVNPDCQGWVCPRGQKCSTHESANSCNFSDDGIRDCGIKRTCKSPIATLDNTMSSSKRVLTQCTIPKTGSIYLTPVYVRSAVNENRTELGESQPTGNGFPITEWLDHLRLKTGMDAIDIWMKQAEENAEYKQFHEWLTSVRTTLGPLPFEIWLREIRKLTTDHPAFQKWLAIDDEVFAFTKNETDNQNNMEQKTSTMFPKKKPQLRIDGRRVDGSTETPVNGNETSTPSGSIQAKNTTLGEDQNESEKVSESPESIRRRYNQTVYDSGLMVTEAPTSESPDSLSEIGEMKNEANPTKTYTSLPPTEDELRIILPWKEVQGLDPEKKRTYYTLTKFPPQRANKQVRIIGYPLVVSGIPPIDRANIAPQSPRAPGDVSQNPESDGDSDRMKTDPQNPWNRFFKYQGIPHRPVPLMPPNRAQLDPAKRLRNEQASSDVQKPFHRVPETRERWYLWNGRTPHYLSKIDRIPMLPIKLEEGQFTGLEEGLKENRSAPGSREYIEAYVDAVIEDALSKVILNWTTSENPAPLSQALEKRFEGKVPVIASDIQGVQLAEKKPSKNVEGQPTDGNHNISDNLETLRSMKPVRTGLNETAATNSSSTDLEPDYRYDCEEQKEKVPQVTDTKQKISRVINDEYSSDSASDELEEYNYSDDREREEYFERSSGLQNEYYENLGTNPTDYNFQYYDDDDNDNDEEGYEAVTENTDVVAKLSKLHG